MLQARVRSFPPAGMPRLFTHNVQVDKWNAFQLSELPGEESVLEAEQGGPDHQREFLTKNLLTPATLKLKPLLRCVNVAWPAPAGAAFQPGICLPAPARKLVKSADAVPQSMLRLEIKYRPAGM